MRFLTRLLAIGSTAALAFGSHPNSVSSSRVAVERGSIRLDLRCQAATLLEAMPLDRDGDGRLGEDELEAGRAALERAILDGYRISTSGADGAWLPVEGKLVEARLAGSAADSDAHVDFLLRFECASSVEALRIDFALFRDSNPFHRDQAQVVWMDGTPQSRLLWIEDPTWISRPGSEGGGGFLPFVGMGFEHILSGYDHVAFLVALVVAAKRLRSLIGVVTAFTLAHSVTLALASLDVVRLPERPVEAAIALSIAWVGFRTAFDPRSRRLWPEAFVFGLVHGLGFARILAESLATRSQKLWGLVGFNLGIEVGQLAIVAASVGLLGLAIRTRRRASDADPGLAPRAVARPVSAAVGLLGLYWLLARTLAG